MPHSPLQRSKNHLPNDCLVAGVIENDGNF